MNAFFELIQIAIGKRESLSRVPQSREEWDELLKITGQHNLLAFTFPVIDRLHDEVNVPLGVYSRWAMMAEKVAAKGNFQKDACVKLYKGFLDNGFRSCILKGQAAGVLYPDPSLRQGGDIDIWVEGEQIKTSKIINDMAKVQQKSEKISAFGGIFFVLDRFDRILSSVIDSHLGLRSKLIGYQYSEIIRAVFSVFCCGGDCMEDLNLYLKDVLTERKGEQLDLFDGEYTYRCILTNDWDMTDEEIIQHYNKRGTAEQVFDRQNNDFGWAHLPKSFMNQNTVFLLITAMAANFYRYIVALPSWLSSLESRPQTESRVSCSDSSMCLPSGLKRQDNTNSTSTQKSHTT